MQALSYADRWVRVFPIIFQFYLNLKALITKTKPPEISRG